VGGPIGNLWIYDFGNVLLMVYLVLLVLLVRGGVMPVSRARVVVRSEVVD